MSSRLHPLSQALPPSSSSMADHRTRTAVDPETQAQTTALRMLAARADQLRDRIGLLLQTIMQDPVGDRTRGSMYPWSTLLEWYQEVTHQAQEFSSFLQNPRIFSSTTTTTGTNALHNHPPPNLLTTTFVQPSRLIGSTTSSSSSSSPYPNPSILLPQIYHQPDPPLRSAPDLAYTESRSTLYTSYADYLLTTLQTPPENLGFIPDQDLFQLLHEDRTDRLPRVFKAVSGEVDRVRKRVGRGREVVGALEGGFDWRVRLGDIYGDGSASGSGSEEEEDGSGDEDEGEDDDDVMGDGKDGKKEANEDDKDDKEVVLVPGSQSTRTRPTDDPEIQIIPHLPTQGSSSTGPAANKTTGITTTTNPTTPIVQGTSSAAPINLDLSDSDSEPDEPKTKTQTLPPTHGAQSVQAPPAEASAVASPAIAPPLTAEFGSTASSPLFGTDDETGTDPGPELEPGTRTGTTTTMGGSPVAGTAGSEGMMMMDVDVDMGMGLSGVGQGRKDDDTNDKKGDDGHDNNNDDDDDEDEEMEEVDA